MDFLDNLVLPQSSEHIMLLHYMLILILFLFIPFISVLFGGVAVSLYYKSRGTRTGNEIYIRFAKDVIETVTLTKGVGVVLGIVPLLTALLIYAQLLHKSGSLTTGMLFISFIFITIGVTLAYTFRYSQSFRELLDGLKDIKSDDEELKTKITNYRQGNFTLGLKSGRWSLIFLFFAVWLFTAGSTAALFSEGWETASWLFFPFSWQVLSRVIFFIASAFALTGASILFANFYWEGGKKFKDAEYKDFVKSKALKITFTSSIVLPLFLLINILALPVPALSKSVFAYAVLVLVAVFAVYHLLYGLTKLKDVKYSGLLFFTVIVVILGSVVHDQLAMANATEKQSLVLSTQYDEYLAQLKGDAAGTVEINGEEVFQRVCSACHRFDAKLVGPAFNETLSKYEGKVNQLVAFIRNPVKVDPAYPPMPNPGLRPNEAKAVAEYILNTYKK